MSAALEALSEEERALLRRAAAPRSLQPMKAVLTEARFSDPNWIYERKLDGVRGLAIRDGEKPRLLSRTGRELNGSYPELIEALEDDPCRRFVADGEIVAF